MARRHGALSAAALDTGAAPEGATLARGERGALGALLRELEPRMSAVALRITREPAAAADVVQSAFEKILRHRRRFRGSARASTWAHRIVANEAFMWLRSEGRRRAAGRALEAAGPLARPEGPLSPAECAERKERVAWLRRGVAALRPEERAVLARCALEGRSLEAFGREAGLRPEAVKSRAFRARRRLRERLEREHEP